MNTRAYVWTVFVVCVAYDVLALSLGWKTISETVRTLDAASGSLIRWAWVALFFHFFLPRPWGGW